MSCNIYEEPNLMDVRYNKRVQQDRGERVERMVDIYESVDTEHHAHLSARDRGVQRNTFISTVLILSLLCILLLVGSGVLFKLYIQTVADKEKLDSENRNLSQLQHDCQNMTGWRRLRCSCYFKSTEKKNWNESREDCKKRGADLVVINSQEEQEFVKEMNQKGESWIGLRTEEKGDGWTNQWEWKWVDGTQVQYHAWKVEVDTAPRYSAMAYVIQVWTYSKDGSRQWICEKPI